VGSDEGLRDCGQALVPDEQRWQRAVAGTCTSGAGLPSTAFDGSVAREVAAANLLPSSGWLQHWSSGTR